jgi:hypothetical protein
MERRGTGARSDGTSDSLSRLGTEINMLLTTKNAALAALLSVGLLTAGGCTQTQRYTAGGAALGAGAGALIGAVTDSSVAGGAVIGGVVGGVAGYCTAQRCFD